MNKQEKIIKIIDKKIILLDKLQDYTDVLENCEAIIKSTESVKLRKSAEREKEFYSKQIDVIRQKLVKLDKEDIDIQNGKDISISESANNVKTLKKAAKKTISFDNFKVEKTPEKISWDEFLNKPLPGYKKMIARDKSGMYRLTDVLIENGDE